MRTDVEIREGISFLLFLVDIFVKSYEIDLEINSEKCHEPNILSVVAALIDKHRIFHDSNRPTEKGVGPRPN